uniref:Tudor domain containing 6 n=1 Tax=Sphaeramia orbicularis TaxID=375764 RepID=A0A672ZA80_9TELE
MVNLVKSVPPKKASWSSFSLDTNLAPQTNTDKLPNLADLPSKTITPGLVADVYISHSPNDDQTFWCQAADSKELDKITLSLSEFDKVEDPRHIDTTTFPLGSPCIALFSKDQHWYRAEVIDKDGDELSVLFVDYGNQSKVKAADVKEITPVLMESPTQAFLCELEGFDSSNGSWDYTFLWILYFKCKIKVSEFHGLIMS